MKRKRFVFLLVLLGIFLGARDVHADIYITEEAPIKDFQLATLGGNQIHLSQLTGKPIIINFFTTWCPSCKEEVPTLIKFYEKYADDVHFLAVNYTAYEVGKIEKVKKYVRENKISFPVLLDEKGDVGKQYEILTIPTTFFLDSHGNVVKKHIGPLTIEEMEQIVSEIK